MGKFAQMGSRERGGTDTIRNSRGKDRSGGESRPPGSQAGTVEAFQELMDRSPRVQTQLRLGEALQRRSFSHGVIQRVAYDELETGASYQVENYGAPLYLRSKRRGGPFLFTPAPRGPMSDAISIDSDAKILAKVSGGRSGPSWFEVTGNEDNDLENLLTMIFKRYKGTADGDFRGASDEIEIGGMREAYQAGMKTYKTLDEFVQRAAELTDWGNDGDRLSDLFVSEDWYPNFKNDLDPLTHRDRSRFLEKVKESPNNFELGISEYDQAFAWEGELWTDGMGPCITIGLTGTYLGKRYNAMLHSQNPGARGERLLEALQSPFGKQGLPALHTLKDVKYFAVGGSSEDYSQAKAESILETFYKENLPVLGATFMTDRGSQELSKAVHVTTEGNVYFSQYDPKSEL